MTFAVYAALAGALFLLPVQLQVVAGFSPVAAGAATLPITVDDAAAVGPDGPVVRADRAAAADDDRPDHRRRWRWSG